MAALSTRFGKASPSLRSATPLSDDQIRAVAPSIFATDPHASRSERYTYIPTAAVLSKLRAEGFQPFMVGQTKVRDESRHEFTKHMIRLRHANSIEATEANEIILLNSHDGTSSYQMLAGMFRFVCMNGLVCGDTFSDIRIRHKGDTTDDVIEGAYTVLDSFERLDEERETMKAIALTPSEETLFGQAALMLKYEPDNTPITTDAILRPRRYDDNGHDLWSAFNRVQENMMKGGLRGRNAEGRRQTTREVTGIDTGTKLNRALWTLADQMRQLKAA